ncbi:hypothetical protein [Streptomyces sp. NPDC001296]
MIPPLVLRALRADVRHMPGRLGTPQLATRLSDHLKHHPLTAMTRTLDGTVVPVVTTDVFQRYRAVLGLGESSKIGLSSWLACASRVERECG